MSNHTPGPWKVVDRTAFRRGASDARWEIDDAEGKHQFWIALAINEADARLVAAAPDLLGALEMVRDADEDCKRDGLPRWCTDAARARIDAALAKAEARNA